MTATVVIPAQRAPEPDPAERWQLVTAAQSGDRAAFGQLYGLYRDRVYRFVYGRTGHRQTAEDITSAVFERALRNIDRLAWQGVDFGAWLTTVARNLCADHYKSSRFRREATCGLDGGPDVVDDDRRGDPQQVTDTNDLSAGLDFALAQLTVGERRVLALRFGAGMSIAETAQQLGKNEGAIKAAQYRACQSLRRHLAAAGVTW